jgi:DMSO reductase family type II enzyme heme b subunit
MSPVRRAATAAGASLLLLAGSARAEVDERGYETVAPVTHASSPEEVERGRVLFASACAQCHGDDGGGDGIAASRVRPLPRDFRTGVYKLRHTFAGELPTDQDLFDTIRKGMPGTSMPAWGGAFSEAEIWSLVAYVKTFSPDFAKFPAEKQLVVGEPPKSSPERLQRGEAIYKELQCAKCHGAQGRGNGPSSRELKDDWGSPIWPADLTRPWDFRGGGGAREIYRTLVTGLSGTPMPSYAPSVTSEDAWSLAAYLASLGRDPVRDVVVRGAKVDSIPDDDSAAAWRDAPGVDLKLAGQVIQDPRTFVPSVDNVTVKALYDDRAFALLLVWPDRTEEGGQGGPPDRAGVQFPAQRGSGTKKPYFLQGDAASAVDFWTWTVGADSAATALSKGTDDVEGKSGARVSARGRYDDGRYVLLLRRALVSPDERDVAVEPGTFTPIAFRMWDGGNGEEGKQGSISAWYYLLLEPETPSTVFVAPALVVLLGFGVEVWVVRALRRRRKERGTAPYPRGGVPAREY